MAHETQLKDNTCYIQYFSEWSLAEVQTTMIDPTNK